MPPRVAITLITLLEPLLQETDRSVPIFQQVLSVVRFIAAGSYQQAVSEENLHPMSQATFSKYLHNVVPAINALADQYIIFPRNHAERVLIQDSFQERLGFPGVIGALDCTLIIIMRPHRNEEAYIDHRRNHSLNVQNVCDTNYNIMNLRVTSGSTHDAFVFKYFTMRAHMDNLRSDDGYTPSSVLLTAVQSANRGTPEFEFSQSLRATRCVVEQTIGVWKQICRCVNKERVLHHQPRFVANIIKAAGVFYNFLRHKGLAVPVAPHRDEEIFYEPIRNNEYRVGLREKRQIMERYF
ncbi:putative nuclease HARBI1, partial [Copidosoma floridanum]|uniref:putative nuclease HARBI1 n=1 Tax=Copidosoma floridanum TaxID=29053 RepID=UPI000C6FC65C